MVKVVTKVVIRPGQGRQVLLLDLEECARSAEVDLRLRRERTLVMAEEAPTDPPAVSPEDKFGVPHGQAVSDSLQLWILIPGLLGLLFIGELTLALDQTRGLV